MFRAIRQHYPDAYIGASVMGSPHLTILKNNKNVDDVINLGAAGLRWRKADGTNATARDVRRALKARFPRHFDPESTYGAADNPTALSI